MLNCPNQGRHNHQDKRHRRRTARTLYSHGAMEMLNKNAESLGNMLLDSHQEYRSIYIVKNKLTRIKKKKSQR